MMTALTSALVTTPARVNSKLHSLIDEVSTTHKVVRITVKKASAVLLSEPDWRAIQETLYLLSVPQMRESIKQGGCGVCDGT